MKVTKSYLRQIILEELQEEGFRDLYDKVKGVFKGKNKKPNNSNLTQAPQQPEDTGIVSGPTITATTDVIQQKFGAAVKKAAASGASGDNIKLLAAAYSKDPKYFIENVIQGDKAARMAKLIDRASAIGTHSSYSTAVDSSQSFDRFKQTILDKQYQNFDEEDLLRLWHTFSFEPEDKEVFKKNLIKMFSKTDKPMNPADAEEIVTRLAGSRPISDFAKSENPEAAKKDWERGSQVKQQPNTGLNYPRILKIIRGLTPSEQLSTTLRNKPKIVSYFVKAVQEFRGDITFYDEYLKSKGLKDGIGNIAAIKESLKQKITKDYLKIMIKESLRNIKK